MYKRQHIHFVGIGGIGMSGLAQVLLTLGNSVSGCDVRETEITRDLARRGATVYKGHAPEHIEGADAVVVSSAVKKDAPELVAARAAKIPVIPRAEMLSELMRLKKFGVAVAGAHGKTSTTSMVAAVLRQGGLDPTVIIGGKVNGWGTNAYWGEGEFLVAEADESDGSFLRLTPSIAVVTNVDREHLDYYQDLSAVCGCFLDFVERIPFFGLGVLCGDDPHLAAMLPQIGKRTTTYGLTEGVELQARDVCLEGLGATYRAWWKDIGLGQVRLRLPGLHNVRNSLAAMAVGLELGIPLRQILEGLESCNGVGRRFQILGDIEGVTVVDDYAHHPTEIRATLAAARACWPDRRLVVLFEPHRYSRTKFLMDEFTTAFDEADMLWLTEIYPASEEPIVGVSGVRLVRRIQELGAVSARYVGSCDDMAKEVAPAMRAGDVVLTLGAGSIGRVGMQLLELLGGKAEVAALG